MISRWESKAESARRMVSYYYRKEIEKLTDYYYDLVNILAAGVHNHDN